MDARRFVSAIYSSQHVRPVTQVVMNLPKDAAEFLGEYRFLNSLLFSSEMVLVAETYFSALYCKESYSTTQYTRVQVP